MNPDMLPYQARTLGHPQRNALPMKNPKSQANFQNEKTYPRVLKIKILPQFFKSIMWWHNLYDHMGSKPRNSTSKKIVGKIFIEWNIRIYMILVFLPPPQQSQSIKEFRWWNKDEGY